MKKPTIAEQVRRLVTDWLENEGPDRDDLEAMQTALEDLSEAVEDALEDAEDFDFTDDEVNGFLSGWERLDDE